MSEVRPEDYSANPTSQDINQMYLEVGADTCVRFSGVYAIDSTVNIRSERVHTDARGAVFYPVGDCREKNLPWFSLSPDFDGTTSGASVKRDRFWWGGTFAKNKSNSRGELADSKTPRGQVFDINGVRSGAISYARFHSVRQPIVGAVADSFDIVGNTFRNYLNGIYVPDVLEQVAQDVWITRNKFTNSKQLVVPSIQINGRDSTHDNKRNGFYNGDLVEFKGRRYYVVDADDDEFQLSDDYAGAPAQLPEEVGLVVLICAGVTLTDRFSNVQVYKNNFASRAGSALYAQASGLNFSFCQNATEQFTDRKIVWVDSNHKEQSLPKLTIDNNELAGSRADTIYIDRLGEQGAVSTIEGNTFPSQGGRHVRVGNLESGSKLVIDKNNMSASTEKQGEILIVESGHGEVQYRTGNAHDSNPGSISAPNLAGNI